MASASHLLLCMGTARRGAGKPGPNSLDSLPIGGNQPCLAPPMLETTARIRARVGSHGFEHIEGDHSRSHGEAR